MGFIDARDLPEGTEIEADLVIIGGGMAGIAIAREWARSNRRVTVIESGGREFDKDIQDLYAGTGVESASDAANETIDDFLIQSRFRALGGAGNVWGGKCLPLDDADFEAREWLPLTGWPMTRRDLQTHYDRACRLLEIPLFNPDNSLAIDEQRPKMIIGGGRDFFSSARCHSRISGRHDKAAFDRFRTEFADSPNITVCLHANVVEIRLAPSGDGVQELDIACLNGRRSKARARAYVLATGGIENARLMLASRSVQKAGVGNANDLVGRCFQGHANYGVDGDPNGDNTGLTISDSSQSLDLYRGDNPVHSVFAATAEGQRRLRIVSFTATLGPPAPAPRADVGGLLTLSGALDRKGPAPPPQYIPCFFKTEQLPNLDSRVVLDEARVDALGVPRVRLEWKFSALDADMLDASINAFAAALGADGKGRVCWPVPRSHFLAVNSPARHHMGTTRMHKDPEFGVVDPDCRVHGLANLYIAGSSVFPTSGNANPTLTLIALAMRLSDHLKARLGA